METGTVRVWDVNSISDAGRTVVHQPKEWNDSGKWESQWESWEEWNRTSEERAEAAEWKDKRPRHDLWGNASLMGVENVGYWNERTDGKGYDGEEEDDYWYDVREDYEGDPLDTHVAQNQCHWTCHSCFEKIYYVGEKNVYDGEVEYFDCFNSRMTRHGYPTKTKRSF